MIYLNQFILRLYIQKYKNIQKYTKNISNIQKYFGKGSGWIIDSVIDHIINISKYNLLAADSYIKLSKELNHPKRVWCLNASASKKKFKWCLVRYLNLADYYPARIRKIEKWFGDETHFEDVKFLHKIGKKNSIGISVFGYENKEKYQLYVSRNTFKKTCRFIINKRKKQKTLCSYQRFWYFSVWLYFTSQQKTVLSLLFASFKHRKNIKVSY